MQKGILPRVLFITIVLLSVSPIANSMQPSNATAARIVVIKPRPDMQVQFEEGYKRHLDWHRRHQDKWTWYGWQVISGERFGYFIDGTFGHRWEDFDQPVSPADDAADNRINVAPHGDFLSLAHYQLLVELSSANLLEQQTPSPFIELIHYELNFGMADSFEQLLRTRQALREKDKPVRYSWYKLISGGKQPSYLLMLPMNKLSELQYSQSIFRDSLEAGKKTGRRGSKLDLIVRSVRSETLRYRSDLSYLASKE